MATQKISKTKADNMIANLKEKLGTRLADLAVVDDIIHEWLNEYIGITEINLECSEAGTILDASEGLI